MASGTVTVTAQCLCKAHNFTAKIPSTSLPLKASCCHCDSCRHQTGALYFACVDWPNRGEDLSSLQRYSFSQRTDIFFCPTCSTPMFSCGTSPGEAPEVTTGVLPNLLNLVEYNSHIFVGDTVDGGASMWLRKNHRTGEALPRWERRSGKHPIQPGPALPDDWPQPYTAHKSWVDSDPTLDSVPIRCHCGGVDLVLRSAADAKSVPSNKLPWFIDPRNHKYLATIDACDSCRLSFGVDLPCWTFAGLDHINFPSPSPTATTTGTTEGSSSPFPRTVSALRSAVATPLGPARDPRLGTLSFFNSSPDVERYFCSRCSACIFYAVHNRPDIVDVAVGVLQHPDGARAEGILAWSLGDPKSMDWGGDTKGGWREMLVEGAVREAEEWRIQRGYPKSWGRIKGEEKASKDGNEGQGCGESGLQETPTGE